MGIWTKKQPAVPPPIVAEPVYAALDRAVKAWPGHKAMYFMGRRWTYRQLGEMVDRYVSAQPPKPAPKKIAEPAAAAPVKSAIGDLKALSNFLRKAIERAKLNS